MSKIRHLEPLTAEPQEKYFTRVNKRRRFAYSLIMIALRFSRARLALAFLLSLVLAALAAAQPITKEQKDEILKGLETFVVERAFVPQVDFSKWPEYLEKQREAIDKAEEQGSFATAVNRVLRNFGVSHISLRTPRSSDTRRTSSTVGVGLQATKTDEGLVVRNLFPKSPADEAGIKEGDIIIEVDGKAPESPAVLNGDENTEITVKLKNKAGEIKEIKLARKRFSMVRPELLTWQDDETATLKIHTFANGYSRTNIETLIGDASKKAKFLVIDLRNNGGGAVENLRHLLSLLMPADTVIGTFVSKTTAKRYLEETGKEAADSIVLARWATINQFKTRAGKIEPFKGKIAVLINGRSGSASEIAAAALRENLKAPIIGTKSAGAVLASVYGRLPHGFEVQYPVQDYVTAQFMRLEKNPVVPDLEAATAAQGEVDQALVKAVEMLKKASSK